jgi:GAF domain-containing protein
VSFAEVEGAIGRIKAETSVSRLLHAACTELVALLGVHRAVVSRVIGDLIVELSDDNPADGRQLDLFLLSDYPATQQLIDQGAPMVVIRSDPDADRAETALLTQLGYGSVLMVPLSSRGKNWGLVEVYADESGFSDAQVDAATSLVNGVGAVLAELESAA